MTTATNWLLNWALAYATPYLVNYGEGNANLQSKIFFVWFGSCFICIAFAYFMVYETRGLTLEQVDEMYTQVHSARKSVGWRPTAILTEFIEKDGGTPEEQTDATSIRQDNQQVKD